MSHPARTHRLATAPLLGWWIFIACSMWRSMRSDPGATGLAGDLPNLHNRPGDLSLYLGLTIAELLVLLLILRPATYRRSWGRALAASALLTPWTLLFLALLIHSGGIMALHFLWLAGLLVGLLALTVVSSIAAVRSKSGVVQRAT